MTASIQPQKADELELGRELQALQLSASIVSYQLRKTNKAFYKHLAELYIWWRGAQKVDGYLERQYATTGKKYKKIKKGINFAPLFWLTWGTDNDLTDDKTGRWSRVLNALHTIYEAEKQYHVDSVAKLQNYIQNNGGVDGLGGYGKVADEEPEDDELGDDDDDASDANDPPPLSLDTMLAQLYGMANVFYGSVSDPLTIDLDYTIPTTKDGMGLVLVRKVGDKYQLVGASSDESMVKPLAMHTYLHDFTALPHSLRTVVETISTQCLPLRLQHFHDALVDASAKSAGTPGLKSIRRLMYVHSRGEFVLSPTRADSGVVTVAKPIRAVLENATRDIFLSTRSRRAVERRLVSGHDFNLYAPATTDAIPEYGPQKYLASHAIRLQHRFAPTTFLHLDFWPFHESIRTPRGQLVAHSLPPGFGTWRDSVSLAWVRKFALEFTSPWVQSHGTHIKRERQKVLQLSFDKAALAVSFVQGDDSFEAEVKIGFGNATAVGKGIAVHVLTKDFVVAMQAVADLGVVSMIDIEIDADVIALSYSTTAASYRLYIPTCTVEGNRSATHFTPYEPKPLLPHEVEDYPDDQREGDFDEAH